MRSEFNDRQQNEGSDQNLQDAAFIFGLNRKPNTFPWAPLPKDSTKRTNDDKIHQGKQMKVPRTDSISTPEKERDLNTIKRGDNGKYTLRQGWLMVERDGRLTANNMVRSPSQYDTPG